jgi:hypothetical protein
MKKQKFIHIPDEDVVQVWECDLHRIVARTAVSPRSYISDGMPTCPNCGGEMKYVCTKIKKTDVEVVVQGGVAYPPFDELPEHITLEIVDKDHQ